MNGERALLAQAIGEYLVSLRQEKQIKQYYLAKETKIPQRTLRTIEKDEVDVSVYLLRRILLVLGEDMQLFWEKVEKNMEVRGENNKTY